MNPTIIDLLDVIRAHLVAFDVPVPCSVSVSTYDPVLTAQLSRTGAEPPELAQQLLAWADTITDPTAHAWRVPDSDTMHIWMTGQLPDGTSVRVYTGWPHTATGLGGGLEPDERAPVPLAALRHLADHTDLSTEDEEVTAP